MKFVFIVTVALFLIACRKTSVSQHAASEAFPDKLGDTWTYLVHDTTWQNFQIIDISNYTMTAAVIGTRLVGGISANVWLYTWPGHTDTCSVSIATDTVRFVDIHEVGLHVFSRQYITPISLNNSWPYTDPAAFNVHVDSEANITVGSNRFENAFHIAGTGGMPDGFFTIDEWFKDNEGTVKRYYNAFGMALGIVHTISWSLVSYDLL